MHDLSSSDVRDVRAPDYQTLEANQLGSSPPEAMLKRQAVLNEFCHRHRKRDLDAYKQAVSNWRFRLWRPWLVKSVTRASRSEEERVRKSGLLDQAWYRLRYPQITRRFSRHYVTTGALEGADPHPLFDTDWYLERYNYPRKQGINPLAHYLAKGWRQGNSPHPLFDVQWYLQAYPEVAEKGVEPLRFYLEEGWRAGHQPNPHFDTRRYLERYPEVEAAGVEPLTHYVTEGVRNGYLYGSDTNDGIGAQQVSELIATLRRQHRGVLERRLKHLADQRDFRACIELFESYARGVEACSQDFTVGSQRAYVRALAREGRAEDALRIAETLVSLSPRAADRHSLLGYLLAGDEPERAREVLRTALRLGSKSVSDAVLIIRTYQIEQKDPVEALKDLESLKGLPHLSRKGTSRDDFHLAMATAHAGTNKRACLEWLNRYLRLYRLAGLTVPDAESWTMDALGFEAAPVRDDGPLVTVLMTSYNAEDHVETAVRSVLNQTYRNLEVILVDDCSSDRTVPLVEAMAQSDARLRVLVNAYNVGTYASKNVALALAKGDLITCHDSDDLSHPEKIARQVRVLERKREVIATTSKWCRMDDTGSLVTKRWGRIVHENPSSLMYRREVVDLIGYYDCVRTSADTEYQERIRARFGSKSIVKRPECMAFGRDRLDSLTAAARFGFDSFGASPLRQAYWRNMVEWHADASKNNPAQLFVPFPPQDDHRPFAAPEEMMTSLEAIRHNCDLHGVDVEVVKS